MPTLALYLAAAFAEIGGCFAMWSVVRGGRSAAWLAPGFAALALFAWLLTFAPSDAAGRAYAAYGGIYILASLLWLRIAEGVSPDRWDLAGAALAVAGAGVILFGRHG